MDLKKRRTLRAIQRLSQIPADGSEDERLAQIAELAVGILDPDAIQQRKHRGGKDRKHRGGQDRAEL